MRLRKKGLFMKKVDNLIRKSQNGNFRGGIIRKCLKFNAEAPWASTSKNHNSIVGFKIDTYEHTIKIDVLKGCDPNYNDLFYALLYDRDVRRCIKQIYEKGEDKFIEYHKIFEKTGMSGSSDIFISKAFTIDQFLSLSTKKVLHISCYDKINEAIPKLEIVELVILANFLGFKDISNRKQLKKRVKFSYVFPRLVEELDTFEHEVPKIL